jgi:Uma2 family endonuclease
VDGARFSTSARVLASNRMQPSAIATMSYAEYVLLEERSREKHEYLWGQVFAMSGGTPEHAALEAAVNRELANALAAAGKPCRVYSANLRVRVEATDFACYPDATVICGKLETSPIDPQAAVNPVLAVEVLSDSTESYDRGIKAGHYRRIPSIREYVLVSRHARMIEVWRKNARGEWEAGRACGEGAKAELESLGVSIDVDAVYRDPLAGAG